MKTPLVSARSTHYKRNRIYLHFVAMCHGLSFHAPYLSVNMAQPVRWLKLAIKTKKGKKKKRSKRRAELLDWRGPHVPQKPLFTNIWKTKGSTQAAQVNPIARKRDEAGEFFCRLKTSCSVACEKVCGKSEKQMVDSLKCENCLNSSSWPGFYRSFEISFTLGFSPQQ